MTRVSLERPDQPEVLRLIDELDAYQKPLYPPESHYGIDINALLQPHVVFAVARCATGEAVGCGAAVIEHGWGELKRMYVRPSHRGAGIAQRIVALLESQAAQRGLALMRLETGVSQPEALRFYERAGYVRRGPFGGYGPDPLSVFMEKPLPGAAAPA
jgi:putative acetyltransferase